MDFKSALNKICQDFNKEILFERRVISILDDYGAFKDAPYYKLFYKTALSSGDLRKLIAINENEREKEMFTFMSLTGFDEQKIDMFISIIYECFYGIQIEHNLENDNTVHKSAANTYSDCKQNVRQSKEISINPLNTTSTVLKIEVYFNSIFEIDYDSFDRQSLILQRIGQIKYNPKINQLILSYEITGSKRFCGNLNLKVFDNHKNLRKIANIGSVNIKDEYSIINEEKFVPIDLNPEEISKLVLTINNCMSNGGAFSHIHKPLVKFQGIVENRISFAKLLDYQILYNTTSGKNEISFYINLRIEKKLHFLHNIQNISALIYDLKGVIRQKCKIIERKGIYDFMYHKEYFFFSISNKIYCETLKIPFEFIGKILFINEEGL